MPARKLEPIRRGELDAGTASIGPTTGLAIVRSCLKCTTPRPNVGGRYIKIAGNRHWLCDLHPPKAKP